MFKTSDGYINIATTGGRIWERCAQAIGAPELLTNPDYATAPARSKNRDALNAEISKLTEKKSTDTWVSELNAAGVPCGPIYSIDQMFEDEQVKHLGIAQDVPNAENRHIRLVGQPVTLSRTPSKMAARPPEFGEQTDEVLAEFGFSADEIARLRQAKVVLVNPQRKPLVWSRAMARRLEGWPRVPLLCNRAVGPDHFMTCRNQFRGSSTYVNEEIDSLFLARAGKR